MKTRTYSMILILTVLMSSVAASAQHDMSKMPESGKKSQGKMGKMDMSTMKQEPHHALAMAYKENLVNFAKTLRHEAAQTKPINSEFARAAVAEMKRSFDQMQEHHQGHMKTMNGPMKAEMADMMKQMDAHQAAVGESLAALDKEVQTATPDPKSVLKYVDGILEHCDAMSKMHGGAMDHKAMDHKKMDHKKTEHKMN